MNEGSGAPPAEHAPEGTGANPGEQTGTVAAKQAPVTETPPGQKKPAEPPWHHDLGESVVYHLTSDDKQHAGFDVEDDFVAGRLVRVNVEEGKHQTANVIVFSPTSGATMFVGGVKYATQSGVGPGSFTFI